MTLIPGARLGPYEIVALLGVGGMGEVYRATDINLKRQVAVKVLPTSVAVDADRLARFQREAEVLAALNHPNIAHIFGLEKADGTFALVMELVEGPTLADRIAQGPIALAEALPIAKQIAEALEAAHEHGIIHRDLKPANIKVREDGTVKVLDFGLAKAMDPAGASSANAKDSPTISIHATQAGVILGTAAYMSPEQARGATVDKRADLWAFGVVLCEMVTGTRPFDGATVSDTLASVLKTEPSWAALPTDTPAPIRRLLRRCLEKDRKRRLDSAAGARLEIDDALTAPAVDLQPTAAAQAAPRRVPLAIAFVLGGGLVAALAIPATRYVRQTTVEPVVTRFDVVTPPTDDPLSFAISPDGRQLIFVGSTENVSRLWVRPLDQVTAHPLAGTDGASYPFWAPGSDAVGFFADGKLKWIDVGGGVPHVLADAPSGRGGSWGRDGFIVFAPSTFGPLLRVGASGGSTVVAKSGSVYRWPQLLPDGRHMLFWGLAVGNESSGVYVAQLDGSQTRRLLSANSGAAYASEDYLLLVDQGVLTARRFDPERVELGNPIVVASAVAEDQTAFKGGISVSASGVLAHRAAAAVRRQLVWIDRHGTRVGTVGPPDENGPINPALSPDGRRVAVQRSTEGKVGVWMLDNTREMAIRFTFTSDKIQGAPLWSPDGSRVLYVSVGALGSPAGGLYELYEKAASGSGTEQVVFASAQFNFPTDWSPDGRVVLFNTLGGKTGWDVWALRLTGDRKPFPVLRTPFDERNGQFAPDGRWIVYDSNESGRFEVYVQPFPTAGGKWQISTAGGFTPRWSNDGREIFYLAPDGAMMAATVRVSPDGQAVEPGTATRLFRVPIVSAEGNRHQYAVAPDSQRFLVNMRPDDAMTAPITIVQNWTLGLKK